MNKSRRTICSDFSKFLPLMTTEGVQFVSSKSLCEPPTSKRSKFRWRSYFLSSSVAVVGIVGYNLYSIHARYSNLLPQDADLLPLPKSNEYIYICDPLAKVGAWQSQLFPWLPQINDLTYTSAWRMVQDAKSDDVEKSRNAVTMLSQMTFDDAQCHQIAQMVDYRTSVALAHSNADPRLVGIPRYISSSHSTANLCERFREILSNLPKDRIHPCVVDWSNAAIRAYSPTEQELDSLDMESITGFDPDLISCSVKVRRKPTEEQVLIPCLQAVLSHSRIMETIPILLKFNIVDLLMTVVEKHKCNQNIMYLIVKIIANLTTCDSQIPSFIKDTGCVRLLAELSESDDLKLSMPARRALHNLDREYNTPILTSGLYQLYPDFRTDEKQLDVDIIFVHGLLGGAFRTWRREDEKPVFRVSIGASPPNSCEKKPSKIKSWFDIFKSSTQGKFGKDTDNDLPKSNKGLKNGKPLTRSWKDGEWHYEDRSGVEQKSSVTSGASQCWPKDWLPRDIKNARILAVDFDSFVTHWTKVCPVENIGRTLFDRSCELLDKLTVAGIGERPIVWVTHSMGGLLVKNLLTQSAKSQQKSTQAVANKTRGIIFCSVPHNGSMIHTNVALNTAGKLLLNPTQEVKELKHGSKELRQLNENFKKLRADRKYKVINFAETKNTHTSIGVKLQLVPLPSADPGYGDFFPLETDHLNVCKVRSRGAFVYQKLVELVENVRNKTGDYDDGEAPLNSEQE